MCVCVWLCRAIGPASRRARKQLLLLRAEKALQRAALQMGRAEINHAGENNGSDEDRQGLGKEEDKGTPHGSDGEESEMDFEDLVRLYGTAQCFRREDFLARRLLESPAVRL